MNVSVNIKNNPDAPAWQKKAWNEFLDMLVERAEALRKKEAGTANTSPSRKGD